MQKNGIFFLGGRKIEKKSAKYWAKVSASFRPRKTTPKKTEKKGQKNEEKIGKKVKNFFFFPTFFLAVFEI